MVEDGLDVFVLLNVWQNYYHEIWMIYSQGELKFCLICLSKEFMTEESFIKEKIRLNVVWKKIIHLNVILLNLLQIYHPYLIFKKLIFYIINVKKNVSR